MFRPAVLILVAAAPALAQTAPLLPPAGVHDTYWPLQIVQWVGPELPYSMMTLYVDDRGKQPLLDAVLTERAGGKRIHYANAPELVAADKRNGDEAYLVRLQFDRPENMAKGATYGLRFNTEKGVPVVWQWVQGTDVSEQGSGVTPLDAPFPLLLYREQGALAGEGTALEVGNVVSTAEVWKQFAQPPYFVPYHGALTQGAHILSLAPTKEIWTGAQPAKLTEGATWTLTDANGRVLTAHVDTLKGQAAAVHFADGRGEAETVDAEQTASGWAVSRVRLGPAGVKTDQTLSLAFSPALAAGAESKFEIVAGKKTKLGAGAVKTGADGLSENWTLTSPDWAKGKSAEASTSLKP